MKKLQLFALNLILLASLLLSACGLQESDISEALQEFANTTQSAQKPETVQSEDTSEAAEPPQNPEQEPENPPEDTIEDKLPIYGEYYYDLTNVVLYIEVYDELPSNYITKAEARELGWEGGSVEAYMEGAAIGGDRFGNYEGLLPEADGRTYTECDIDTNGYSSRGSRRLVFSNDGLYFYTSDHYESFSEITVTEDYEVIR